MATIGTTSYPAYVYDADTDTWVPIGVGAHTHDAVPQTTIDAKGDLIVGTADNTVARVAVGSNNALLTADSSQTSGVKWSATVTNPTLVSPRETWTVSATAATGTIQFDCLTQGVLYYTTNSSGNWTLNFRGNSGTSLNSLMATGDAITVNFLATNSTAYYQNTAVTVDTNATVSIKWSGGTAPSAGNASSIDTYSYTIVKTGTSAFTVLCAGPIKYA